MHRVVALIWLCVMPGYAVAGELVPEDVPAIAQTLVACAKAEDERPSEAIELANQLLTHAASLPIVQKAEALGCRGWAHLGVGNRTEASMDAHAVASIALTLPLGPERVRLTRRAGSTLHRSGQRIGAVEYYARAALDAEQAGLDAERIPLLVNLGVLHAEFEEHVRAETSFTQALQLMERLGDLRHEAAVRFNFGLMLSGLRRYQNASVHLRRALQLAQEQGVSSQQQVAIQVGLAKVLLLQGDNAQGAALAKAIFANEKQERGGVQHWNTVGLRALYEGIRGRHAAALSVLDSYPGQTLNGMQRVGWLEHRAELLEKVGRPLDALDMLRQAGALREEHLRQLNHERLAALDAHMRNREQQLELERLQMQAARLDSERVQERKQQRAMVGAVLLLLAGAVFIAMWQRRVNRLLLHASQTDPLTSLANRRKMGQLLADACLRGGPSHAVFLLDIDYFKRVNDVYGHDVGDQVLMAYAERLRAFVGKHGAVARWGGEEFMVLMPVADAGQAGAIAEQLSRVLAAPMSTRAGDVQVTASIGIANLPLPGTDTQQAWHFTLQIADAALYTAKRAGREGWVSLWADRVHAEWSPERMARDTALAVSLGVLQRRSSRPVREGDDPVASSRPVQQDVALEAGK